MRQPPTAYLQSRSTIENRSSIGPQPLLAVRHDYRPAAGSGA